MKKILPRILPGYALLASTLFLATTSLLLSPDPAVAAQEEPLVFKGCSIIRRAFMSEAAIAYQKKTGRQIIVTGGGATMGIRATAAGDANIGGSCRPALPDLFEQEQGVYMTQIAWDALVFITHPSNPVDSLTLQQAKDILLGKITHWKSLGGPDERIIAVFRSQVPEHGGKVSGVGYMARRLLFDDRNMDFTSKALFFRHSSEVEKNIESIPYTFGVTGVSSARKRLVKILKLDGIEPSKKNIASAAYPLFRPLYLITRGKAAGEEKAFIDWLLSDAGQQVVSNQGTVNLREGAKLNKLFKHWEHRDLIENPSP